VTPQALGLLCLLLLAHPVRADDNLFKVARRAQTLLQGEILRIVVSGQSVAEITGHLEERPVPFAAVQDGVYLALVGVDMEQKPGPRRVIIKARGLSGATQESSVDFRVKPKRFPEERFSVPPSFDQLDQATLARIRDENERLDKIWKSATPGRLWDGSFLLPVKGEVSSPFGLRRVINGLARAPHSGVDLKVQLGTEILAANHGKVVLRDEFFFSGKTVVLDHGGGLYTMYFHLNEFQVPEGMSVHRGEVIGRVGMTGRVTGPHLHWGARLQGARVDPLELLKATEITP
jgi:murein DD-endopeptidase MepM/ murein hydrolase activator NlpD